MRRIGGGCAILSLSACISVPELRPRDASPVAGTDGGFFDADLVDADAAPDGGGRCEVVPAGAGLTLSSANFEVHLRLPRLVADVNCDGRDDVLISNHGTQLNERGVIVFLGRDQGFGVNYDQFLSSRIDPMLGVDPHAIAVERGVSGDNFFDLLILGNDTGPSAQNRILLSVYRGQSNPAELFGGGRLTKTFTETSEQLIGGDRNAAQPVFLASANFDGDAYPDLVAGDLTKVFVLAASRSWDSSFNVLTARAYVRSGAPWENAIGATPVFWSRAAVQDFLVASSYDVTYVENDGLGGFDETPPRWMVPAPGYRNLAAIDLDGSGRPDVAGVAGDRVSVIRINHDAAGAPLGADVLPFGTALPFMDATADDLIAVDLDRENTPEIVVLDIESAPSVSRLYVIEDPRLEQSTVTSTRTVNQAISGFDPIFVTAADTNGDNLPEIWLWAVDGATRCYRYVAAEFPRLELCP